jgi:hypothetical protein
MIGNPELTSSPVGLVPRNAPVLNKPMNSGTVIREVVWSAAGRMWLNHEDLRNNPLIERKVRLRELIERNKPERIIYAQHVE